MQRGESSLQQPVSTGDNAADIIMWILYTLQGRDSWFCWVPCRQQLVSTGDNAADIVALIDTSYEGETFIYWALLIFSLWARLDNCSGVNVPCRQQPVGTGDSAADIVALIDTPYTEETADSAGS